MNQPEVWTIIIDYNGKYLISTLGKVKTYYGKELNTKYSNTKDERRRLRLTSKKGAKQFLLKRLMFDNFVMHTTTRVVITHIDGDIENCKLDNLIVHKGHRILFNGATDIIIKEILVPEHKKLIVEIKAHS